MIAMKGYKRHLGRCSLCHMDEEVYVYSTVNFKSEDLCFFCLHLTGDKTERRETARSMRLLVRALSMPPEIRKKL